MGLDKIIISHLESAGMEESGFSCEIYILATIYISESLKLFKIAVFIENGNSDEIKKVYNKEIEAHGNEKRALLCLKVSKIIFPLTMKFFSHTKFIISE